jgi:hypothetical protein
MRKDMPTATRDRLGRESGVAMLEFVMMLPFIWIILVLIFDFGQGFLERQRAMVAAREAGIRSAMGRKNAAQEVVGDTLEPRGMGGDFDIADGGTCPRQDPFNQQQLTDAFDTSGLWGELIQGISSLLGRVSKTKAYALTAHGRPITGRLLDAQPYKVCFAIDDGTWTSEEIGGNYGSIILNVLKDIF